MISRKTLLLSAALLALARPAIGALSFHADVGVPQVGSWSAPITSTPLLGYGKLTNPQRAAFLPGTTVPIDLNFSAPVETRMFSAGVFTDGEASKGQFRFRLTNPILAGDSFTISVDYPLGLGPGRAGATVPVMGGPLPSTSIVDTGQSIRQAQGLYEDYGGIELPGDVTYEYHGFGMDGNEIDTSSLLFNSFANGNGELTWFDSSTGSVGIPPSVIDGAPVASGLGAVFNYSNALAAGTTSADDFGISIIDNNNGTDWVFGRSEWTITAGATDIVAGTAFRLSFGGAPIPEPSRPTLLLLVGCTFLLRRCR